MLRDQDFFSSECRQTIDTNTLTYANEHTKLNSGQLTWVTKT